MGITTTKKNRISKRVFEIANQLLTHHSVYLASGIITSY